MLVKTTCVNNKSLHSSMTLGINSVLLHQGQRDEKVIPTWTNVGKQTNANTNEKDIYTSYLVKDTNTTKRWVIFSEIAAKAKNDTSNWVDFYCILTMTCSIILVQWLFAYNQMQKRTYCNTPTCVATKSSIYCITGHIQGGADFVGDSVPLDQPELCPSWTGL